MSSKAVIQPESEQGAATSQQKKRAYARELRQQRSEAGLCVTCNQPRGEDGTETLCRPCAEKLRERYHRRVDRRAAARLCVACGELLGKGRTGVLCHSCADKQSQWRKHRIEGGHCRNCGKLRGKNGTETVCSRCAKEQKERSNLRRDRMKEVGHCPSCGKSRDDKTKIYCSRCRERHGERTKRQRKHRIEEGHCPVHPKSPLLVLKLCPMCHYETTDVPASSISFKAFLLPPDSSDKDAKLDTCVGCEHCNRLYHKGETSYPLPRIPPDLKLRDEHIGEEGRGVWLRLAHEDEPGQVEIEFEKCSLPYEKCTKLVPKRKALIYLRRYRAGEQMSMTCKEHFNDRSHLTKAHEARLRQQFDKSAQAHNDDGQKNEDTERRNEKLQAERAEFESAVRELKRTLPSHKISRPVIAAEYDHQRKTREPLDPSTITKIVQRCYPKGTSVADAVAMVS